MELQIKNTVVYQKGNKPSAIDPYQFRRLKNRSQYIHKIRILNKYNKEYKDLSNNRKLSQDRNSL